MRVSWLMGTLSLLLLIRPAFSSEYFPVDNEGIKGIPKFDHVFYARPLEWMGEPSIQEGEKGQLKFRLLIVPSLTRETLAVRVERTPEGAELTRRILSRSSDGRSVEVTEDQHWIITEPKFNQFMERFRKAGFFRHSTLSDYRGLDGEEWLLEANVNGLYHVVVRWVPTSDTAERHLEGFVNACQWLARQEPEWISPIRENL